MTYAPFGPFGDSYYHEPIRPIKQQTRSTNMATSQYRKQHEADMALLGERLLEAAKDHDLCDTFYEVMESINQHLTVPVPVKRNHKGEVDFYIHVRLNDVDVEKGRFGDGALDEAVLEDFESILVNAVESALNKAGHHIAYVEMDDHEVSLND